MAISGVQNITLLKKKDKITYS